MPGWGAKKGCGRMKVSEYAPGVPCWVDLGTPDVEGAEWFYGALFGWTPQPSTPEAGGYTFFHKGDGPRGRGGRREGAQRAARRARRRADGGVPRRERHAVRGVAGAGVPRGDRRDRTGGVRVERSDDPRPRGGHRVLRAGVRLDPEGQRQPRRSLYRVPARRAHDRRDDADARRGVAG